MNAQTISRQWRLLGAILLSIALLFGGTGAVTAQTIPEPVGPFTYVCHATGAEGHWTEARASEAGEFNGHMGMSHQGGRDIIPPFTYNGQVYSQNWTPENWTIWFFGCEAAPTASPAPVEFTQATCFEPATLTLPANGGGVTYSSVGIVEAGGMVTVTATIDNTSHVWGVVADPWVVTSTNTATQTIMFDVPDCPTPVVPGELVITQATCEEDASLVVPENGDVTYVVEGTVAAGETVTVTANIDPTLHVWGTPIEPWVLVDEATLTQEIVFTVPECPTQVVPGELVITQATCEEDASLVVPENGDVTYVVEGTVAAGETVTVTANIDPTLHVWGTPIEPWVLVDEATLTQEIVFTVPECPTPTETPPETPVVTPTETPVVVPTETPVVVPTETPLVVATETPVVPPTVEPATDMPVTGSGTDPRGQLVIAVASVVALGIIALGVRRYSDV